MRKTITLGLAALMLAGCMGGPPIRSVANDPEEMARRRAATDREIARRTASLERHRAAERQRAAEAAGYGAGVSGPAQPSHNREAWDSNKRRTDCVLRATRAQLNSGHCN